MSRPHAPHSASTAPPNTAIAAPAPVYNARINAAGPAPRHPILPFDGRFRPFAVPPPAPYPASFYQMRRPPVFPPAAFHGPHAYLPRPPPPGGFIPFPGPPFNPYVDPRYITQYPVYQQPLGFPPRPIYPPIGVLSHQRPAVIDGTSGPVAVSRPPTVFAPVAPADEPQFIVFVGRIASTVNSNFVLSLLQVCGVVKSWNRVRNPDGTRTAFGFCEFDSAEGGLRARQLLNKLSIDGQELVLNVNEATKLGENTTEQNAREAETETMDGMVCLADNGNDSSRAIPDLTEMGAVVGGQMSSQGKTKRCRYDTEEYSDADKDAMQKIRFMIEDRMKSKLEVREDGEVSEDGESSLQIREDGEVSENGESSLQIREDGELSEDGTSSLQIDAVSSMHIPMDWEPTVDHKRKRQHMESDGFHKSSDEETGIVSVPGLVSDKQDSGAPGEKVGLQLQAPSKSGNEETLDAKQLLAAVPKTKEELFAYDVDWAIYDKHGLHEKMRPWISEKTTEIFGEEIPEFVEYVVASTKEHVEAPRMLEALASLMDHSAEEFLLWLWTKLIFEIKKAETGS
ncbi:hypothetical protein QYE76_004902 [Lolium multiflorum]|uniref:RRM domain-containing protein n=1 Tax=Lolium multiflorum TaxID=4521 RepID=A0AAD8W0N5_LOLMU|nr:hypothetical protein QYE76_004902 [Lolium multiflorum]